MATPSPYLPDPLARLVDEFSKLPGIGTKTAQRLAFHLIRTPETRARDLADAIIGVKERIAACSRCYNIAESDPCDICADPRRDPSKICVVEEALDVLALERAAAYRGGYHVLHGAISPMNGVGPDDLRIAPLLERVKSEPIEELILATNPNVEGDATAMYIHGLIAPLGTGIAITRPARGLPTGGDLEYADQTTLGRAIEGRQGF